MQKFLKDTIESRFIKAILQDTYIPNYQSVIEGDYIVEDTFYVYRHRIIQCTKSGILSKDGKYKVIDNYNKNVLDQTFMSNFNSKESFYDAGTHKALGEYLRYYRGQTYIDLMPLYNCYNNVYNSSFTLNKNGLTNKPNKLVKVLQVPIKFNKTYTVAIDCYSELIMCAAFIIDGDYVFVGNDNITQMLYDTDNKPVKVCSSTDFLKPETFRIDNNDSFLQKYEYTLTLLIQIPYNCDSSVVVLEGDYTNNKYQHIISTEEFSTYNGLSSISKYDKNKLFVSNLSLLEVNDRVTYPFADKLILYLLQSSITSAETIYKNILRVQEKLDASYYYNTIDDVWDDYIRKIIYDKYWDKTKDVIGYVDADIENFLLKE